MSTVRNLEEPCALCDGKLVGDHTMREWAEHVDRPTDDLPYEEAPGGPVRMTLDGEELVLADTLVARATIVGSDEGLVKAVVGCLLIDYQVGNPTGIPETVARVALIGPPAGLRKAGRLLRDTANGAATAVEQAS